MLNVENWLDLREELGSLADIEERTVSPFFGSYLHVTTKREDGKLKGYILSSLFIDEVPTARDISSRFVTPDMRAFHVKQMREMGVVKVFREFSTKAEWFH